MIHLLKSKLSRPKMSGETCQDLEMYREIKPIYKNKDKLEAGDVFLFPKEKKSKFKRVIFKYKKQLGFHHYLKGKGICFAPITKILKNPRLKIYARIIPKYIKSFGNVQGVR